MFFRTIIILGLLVGFAPGALASQTGQIEALETQGSYQIAARKKRSRKTRYQGDVYLLRGLADIFSRGMDTLGQKLVARGINAKVLNHSNWRTITNIIIRNQKRYGRVPIVLMGHSYGADAVVHIAEELKRRNIRVKYMVTFDPTVRLKVPSNIAIAVNYYLSNSVSGVPLKKTPGSRGSFKNVDLISKGVTHFNIEKQARVHKVIIRNVLRFVRAKKRKKTALLLQ
jgi:hypothetical protein